tara:strand:- start:110 stop:484 length:375 start_codon:yes stop_codon:yes gene_type:complete
MREEIITFETAVLAKDMGFNIEVPESYGNDGGFYISKNKDLIPNWSRVYAPTQTILQKWLREKHNLHCMVYPTYDGEKNMYRLYYGIEPVESLNDNYSFEYTDKEYPTYEEALEVGLQELLNYI